MTRYTHTIIKTCSGWSGYRKRNAAPRMTDKRGLEEWGRREQKRERLQLYICLHS